MPEFVVKTKILLFSALFLVLACAPAAPRKKVAAPAPQPPAVKPAEKAAPVKVAAPEPAPLPVPAPLPKKRAVKPHTYTLVDSASLGNEVVLSKAKLLMEEEELTGPVPETDEKGKRKKKLVIVPGFRLQVYATANFKEAERKKQDLMGSIEERVYVDYEAPYYKIRVGNFEKEADAKTLKRKLTELGHDAWVVKSKIRIRK